MANMYSFQSLECAEYIKRTDLKTMLFRFANHNRKKSMNLSLPFDAGLQVVAEADLGLVEPVN